MSEAQETAAQETAAQAEQRRRKAKRQLQEFLAAADGTSLPGGDGEEDVDPEMASYCSSVSKIVAGLCLGTLVLLAVVRVVLLVVESFSPMVAVLVVNLVGGLGLFVGFVYLRRYEAAAKQRHRELIRAAVQKRKEAKAAEAPHQVPDGYQPPAGWKPGDGCPAMLPESWFGEKESRPKKD